MHIITLINKPVFLVIMAEFRYELRIPKERIAVLIGKEGETKKWIEDSTKTKLEIDSAEGDVIVSGGDALSLYSTKDMILAIGRGFNPDIVKTLLKPDYAFEAIHLPDYVKETHLERVRGRIIGSAGKTRRIIEDLTDTNLCVYGKTVSLIGRHENIMIAKRAIESLLKGSPHSSVYTWLEKQRRELNQTNLLATDKNFKEE